MSEHRGGSDLVSVVECVVRDCSSGKWRTVGGYAALSGGSLDAVGPHRYLLPKARESTGSSWTTQARLHVGKVALRPALSPGGIACRCRWLRGSVARSGRSGRSGHGQVQARVRRRPAAHRARAPGSSSRLSLVLSNPAGRVPGFLLSGPQLHEVRRIKCFSRPFTVPS
jgi:hypothetical protein